MSLACSQRPQSLAAEILDDLPFDHPEAVGSRRDLRYFNAALGHWRWIERVVPGRVRPGERVLEIGAGTGELGARMRSKGLQWDGLDRLPRPAVWPVDARWHESDVFTFDRWHEYGVVVGNLVFHHFNRAQLAELGRMLDRHARVIVIADLQRGRIQEWVFSLFAHAIGANRVSLHDGRLSIRAGFRGNELGTQLGLEPGRWRWNVVRSQIAAHRFVAERVP